MEESHVLKFLEKLNSKMNLKIKKITNQNFSNFGQLITTKDSEFKQINNNTTTSFFNLVDIEILGEDKQPRVNIFKAKKRKFPIEINMMEIHPFSSQAFIPLQKTTFIVVVAPISKIPDQNLIEAFIVPSEEGINFKPK